MPASHTIQPLLNKQYIKASSAQGIYITDENGKKYLDGCSGAVACSLGHSHPKILPFVKQQLNKLQFIYRSQFATEEADRLSEKLCAISPGRKYAHTFFVNSGTEAVETAMKVALQYWQEVGKSSKKQFITRKKSYHGITMGALSLSGHPIRRRRFEDELQKYPRLSADLENDPREKHVEELQRVLESLEKENVAALVLEPIVGAAGAALVPPAAYYSAMKKVCEENEILFITDEVMSGLGRTGTWFAIEHWSTHADIVAIGKALGAGYAPIAATLMTDKVIDPFRKGSGMIISGHTYSGHTLSCATAWKVLQTVEEDNLLENVIAMGDYLMQGLVRLQTKHSTIQCVRGKGLLIGIEFQPSIAGSQAKFIDRCFENGLLVYPSVGGKEGNDENAVLVSPPYIISRTEADELLQKFELSLSSLS